MMHKIKIKNTDLLVSPISYGTTKLGIGRTLEEDFELLDAFYDAGGNFIDTARVYSDWIPGKTGRSELVLGEWLKKRAYPKDLVIATKGAHPKLDGHKISRLSEEEVEYDITMSLKALGTETLDLYYLHRDDKTISVEYIIDYLEYFKQKGYIRHYACSNWKTERIMQANAYSKQKRFSGFVANEMYWNLASAHMKPPYDPTLVVMNEKMYGMHEQTGLTAVPYSAQAGGYFSKLIGAYEKAASMPYHSPENERRAKELRVMFGDVSATRYVLGYFFGRPFQVIPAFSASDMEQLKDTIKAAENPINPGIMF